ncbi:amidohydrolase family protein [Bradyrhizobium sp. dw_78]|uniref:amidohydrolase family protein n=1 Tax=Bradyrhizobium sp. dw_78 TaxID=2719793 RepID=UPI001BD5D4AF|nr:amidohydrolase family protein [Bradyrhizobium sp. dw_78]
MITLISGGTIIAYKDGGHRVLKDGVLVFEGDRIIHVGTAYDGKVDQTINAAGKLVIPGFVSTHAHVNAHEGSRLITDLGRRDVMRSGFLNYTPNNGIDGRPVVAAASAEHSIRFGFAQLIRNGVTTVLSFGAGSRDDPKLMTDLADESGLRVYYAPQATGAENYFDKDHQGRLQPIWNEAVGFEQLERAVRYVEDHHGKFDGRLQGLILVRNFILATVPLMRRAKEYADRLGVQFSTHFCEQLFEFHETVRTHGMTPVDLMEAEGLLGPNVILAHCVYIAGHSSTTWEYSNDLEKLGRTGSVVAHAPVAYLRRGYNLEGFERYLAHNVTMSMGTDVMPHDMLGEMRSGALAAKLIGKNHEAGTSASFFDAATLGGAKAFGRTDIGRLSAGAKADIVILDFDNMQIGPVYDPIRSLVHLATPHLIETVICDGKTLMSDGVLTGYDERSVVEGGKRSLQQVVDQFPERHWSGKSAAECFPVSYAAW